jgi:hypothetical protein
LRHFIALSWAFFGVATVGCTLATQGDSLSEGCPEGMKECDGACVGVNEVEHGCGRAGCSPCAVPHAVSRCSDEGECIIASCVGSWEDCDRRQDNGCEANLDVDSENCGRCSAICQKPAQGEAACAQSRCYVRTCEAPYSDCNYDARDGCEAHLDEDDDHCGKCNRKCGADETCFLGACITPD